MPMTPGQQMPTYPGQYPGNVPMAPKKSKAPLIITLVVLALVGSAVGVGSWMIIGPGSVGKLELLDESGYHVLGSDLVPSLPFVIGHKHTLIDGEASSRDSTHHYITASFTTEVDPTEHRYPEREVFPGMQTYVHHLIKEQGFHLVAYAGLAEPGGRRDADRLREDIELWKPSEDRNYFLVMILSYTATQYSVEIHKTKGYDPDPRTDPSETADSLQGIEYVVPAGWVPITKYGWTSKLYLHDDLIITVSSRPWTTDVQDFVTYRLVAGVSDNLGHNVRGELGPWHFADQEATYFGYNDRISAEQVIAYIADHKSQVYVVQCSAPGTVLEKTKKAKEDCQALAETIRIT
ncbi:MAG: hypothetical protein FWG08_02685 [Propionibacteriaceae bacterium]|nr:hypothetical protein [Propionibacteriaceae bacterium]